MKRKAPRWVAPFLRALERTGEVRTAACDAGIDHSSAYARRKAHADFALAWAQALAAGKRRRDEERRAEMDEAVKALGKGPSTNASAGNGPLPRAQLGEDLVNTGRQLKRAGPGRWSKAKEQAVLAELASSGSVRRACLAVGLSRETLRKRRRGDRHFDAACLTAIERARGDLNGLLVEAGHRTFDPDSLPEGEEPVLPALSVAEAIQVIKLGGPAAAAGTVEAYDAEELAGRLENKLRMIRISEDAALQADGWTEHEGHWIPPGWVKDGCCARCRGGTGAPPAGECNPPAR